MLLWDEFAYNICSRFARGGHENLIGQFNKLLQKGKVDDYIRRFEELKTYMWTQNKGCTEEYFIESFLSGLKEEIANALYIVRPQTLRDVIIQARGQQIYLESLDRRSQGAQRLMGEKTVYKAKPNFTTNKGSVQPTRKEFAQKSFPVKRLTAAEMAARREKGLCYNCDEVYI